MSDNTAQAETGDSIDPQVLVEAITAYQQAHAAWQGSRSQDQAVREEQRAAVRRRTNVLWPLLQRILYPVAYDWAARHQMRSVESLSRKEAADEVLTNLCLAVIDQLPHLKIDPAANTVGLLRTIARRHEIDGYRRDTRKHELRDEAIAHNEGEPSRRRYQEVYDDEALARCVDEYLRHFDEHVIEREHARTAVAAITAHWRATLSAEELYLLTARLLSDPPILHTEIAATLGPPWNSELVRMRQHRILKRSQVYLRREGYVE